MNVPRRQENVCINKTTWPPWRQRYWGPNGLLCINTAVHSLKAGKCRDNEKKNAVFIRKEKKITEPWVIVPNFTTTKKTFFSLNSISGWDHIYIFNFLDFSLLTTISLWMTWWTSGKAPSLRWFSISQPTDSHSIFSSISSPKNFLALQKTFITKAVNLGRTHRKTD